MKFTVPTKPFRDAFTTAAKVCPSKAVIPVLQSVRLTADESGLSLAASDSQIWIGLRVPCETIDSHGTVLLPKSSVESVLRTVDGESLSFALDGLKLTMIAGSARWNLTTTDPDTFPTVPGFSAAAWHTLASADLKRLTKRTAHAVDPASLRYALGGMLFTGSPVQVEFTATDGRVIADQSVPASFTGEHADTKGQSVIPETTLALLIGLLPDGDVDLGFPDAGTVQFRSGDLVLTSRLTEGRFPNWRLAVPKETIARVTVGSAALLRAVEQASAFRSDESRAIDLDFTPDMLRLTAWTADAGDTAVEFPLEGWSGPPVRFSAGSELMADMLKPLGDQPVTLEFDDMETTAEGLKNVVLKTADGFLGMIATMNVRVK